MSNREQALRELLSLDLLEVFFEHKTEGGNYIFSIFPPNKLKAKCPVIYKHIKEYWENYSLAAKIEEDQLQASGSVFEPGHPDYETGRTVEYTREVDPTEAVYSVDHWVVYNNQD